MFERKKNFIEEKKLFLGFDDVEKFAFEPGESQVGELWVIGWRIESDAGGPVVKAFEERSGCGFGTEVCEHACCGFCLGLDVAIVVVFLTEGSEETEVFFLLT